MSILKNTRLRHKSKGYIRLEIPEELCRPSVAPIFTAELNKIQGVYRVILYNRQGKLSIRYLDTLCDFQSLIKQVAEIAGSLEKKGIFTLPSTSKPESRRPEKLRVSHSVRWLNEKINAGKETVTAAMALLKSNSDKPGRFFKDPEKAAIDFLNDILVLYLIKRHWHLIIQHWIKQPFLYRYEWLTVFYLIFLLVRSRQSNTKPPVAEQEN
ncbi:MAG: hypothetical protein V3V31_13965 [Methylococcales bacterium]